MHDPCMATKTISLELDAYERLARAKRGPRDSFSAVVRRARWDDEPMTGDKLLARMHAMIANGESLLGIAEIDRLDEAQRHPRRSSSKWAL
jgi:hypothetical protein